ncbi:hypothetical protein [Ilumatobacter coccineus]|uniref:Uncharacterized protein n=1 Tax=Ilumatobacter coccineus (strain NBRC 103263 / KCTC 29153 / YM16-304) TaxID=1313172 RepID=A0A6C7EAJ7_ILUCY|nr:hypothetical protein [Ilumatobacter coccineus]BAN01056.1 hypothetical protein YM304_07420 [Ilumatobacter coccineus YM16-304]
MTKNSASASRLRSRWAAIGAAVAVTIGAGGLGLVNAQSATSDGLTYVPLTPCRLADSRPGTDNVGPYDERIGATTQKFSFDGRGTSGDCALPANAEALTMNVTGIQPDANSFYTLYPEDLASPPLAAHLVLGALTVTENEVTVTLDDDGEFTLFNNAGTSHVVIDVLGAFVGAERTSCDTTAIVRGTAGFYIGDAGVFVTFDDPLPTATYTLLIQTNNTGGYSTTTEATYFNPLKKTATGFQIQHKTTDDDTPLAVDQSVGLDWVVMYDGDECATSDSSTIVRGTTGFGIGDAGVVVTFADPLPDADYSLFIQPNNNGGYSTTTEATYFNPLKKTATGFQIQHKTTDDDTPLAVDQNVGIDWMVVYD